ncbi:uncharacterized protein LOC143607888 [Bidens hawaiensis]|uniref:uncharacterized protein LOC143607888 n=1 Tax=Bidens hawaiensis TaxID=980011 RepID=UPI00404A58BA
MWAVRIKAVFRYHGIWDVIEPGSTDEKKNGAAIALFFQSIPEDQIMQVAQYETAKDIWNAIKTQYVGAERVVEARLHTLITEFEGMRMKDTESIDDFSRRLFGIASKFASLSSPLDEQRLVRKFFTSMPKRFINVVASLEQVIDLKTIKYEEAVGRLKAYEDRVKNVDDEPENNGKLLFNRAKTGEFNGKSKGEFEQSRDDSKGDRNKEENVHLKRYESEPMEDGVWYLDNGASNHMTGMKSYFSELDETFIGQVRFGDSSCVDIKGKGSITIICDDDVERIISNVYFIPNLTSNILRLGQAMERGCKVIMEDDQILVLNKSRKVIMKSVRSRNRLYKVRLRVETPTRVETSIWIETPMCLLSVTSVKKFDDRSTSMVNLGTEPGKREYRKYDPVQNQIHVSRDVIFYEKRGLKWDDKNPENRVNSLQRSPSGATQCSFSVVETVGQATQSTDSIAAGNLQPNSKF